MMTLMMMVTAMTMTMMIKMMMTTMMMMMMMTQFTFIVDLTVPVNIGFPDHLIHLQYSISPSQSCSLFVYQFYVDNLARVAIMECSLRK